MACSLDIKYDIIDDVTGKLTKSGAVIENQAGYFPNPSLATKAINSINKEYGEIVVKEGEKGSFFIEPSQRLVDEYYQDYLDKLAESEARSIIDDEMARGGYTEEHRGEFFQVTSNEIEDANQKLDDHLLNFLKPFGVTSKEVEVLKNRLNEDSLGVADVLNKLITIAKNRKIDTVPEEAGHMLVMLMGENHPEIKGLLKSIEKWSGYKKVYDEYFDRYYNEKQIKIEAIGKVIANALVRGFKESTQDKSIFYQVRKAIESFFRMLNRLNPFYSNFYTYNLADKIAKNVLLGNTEYVANLTKPNPKLDYSKTVEDNPLGKWIINTFTGQKFGFKLTGSLAIAGQGEFIYRPGDEPIHDLDFVVNDKSKREQLSTFLDSVNAVPVHYGIKGDDYTTLAYYIPKEGYTVEVTKRTDYGMATDVVVRDKNGKEVDANAQNLIGVDFFVYAAPSKEQTKSIFTSWQDIYKGKLSLSQLKSGERMFAREKDQTDYILSNPKSRDRELGQFTYLQTEEVPASAASPETIDKVKQVLDKMGISVKDLVSYAREAGLDTRGINGLADLTQKLIAIAEGKEGVAITEEMVHVATAIIEQVNPKMVTEMISKIDRFSIYKEVFEAYKDKYKLSNGKPDIRKIKKEAVDKLIAEIIINENDGKTEYPELMKEENQSLVRRWWNAIVDFFRGMYRKSNINIFEEAAGKIMSEEGVGTVEQVGDEGVFFQTKTDVQKNISDKLEATKNNIEKVTEEQAKVDPLLLDSEEATNFYKIKNAKGVWERIKNRVTDRVKEWYAQRFPGRTFTEAEKKFNEQKRIIGVKGHDDFQEIHSRYYNADGTKKAKPDNPPSKINIQSREMYDKLETYFSEFVNLLPQGTLVFSEKIIYDEKAKEAGTIDLLAIEPSGKAHILDWKFMGIAKGADDVAWYKQGAYNVQLGRYKQILADNYGIKEFGMMRAIPILLEFRPENKNDPKSKSVLTGIAVGSIDTSKIEDIRLLPISEVTETTGNIALDQTIKDLNSALAQIGKEKVTNEEERLLKREELQLVQRAIRLARGKSDLAPLVDVVSVIKSSGDRILNDYNTIYKDKKPSDTDSDNKALSEFSDELREYLELSDVFKDVDRRLGDLIYQEEWRKGVTDEEYLKNLDYRKEILTKLRNQVDSIYKTNMSLTAVQKDFADVHIGQKNLISGLTSNEKVVAGLFSRFRGASELPSKAINLLVKLTNSAKGKAMADALEEVKQIMDIRTRLSKRGGNLRLLSQNIYQKDDMGGLVNKLIHKYDRQFYEAIDGLEGSNETKLKWLSDNIDVEKYKKDADKILNDRIATIKRNHPDDIEVQAKMIEDEQKRWNIDREDFNGWDRDNYILKRYPLDKWFSAEYQAIRADKDLNDLYNFVYKLNEKAADIGYISNAVAKTFLPFVRKTAAEGLVWDGTLSAIDTWSENLKRRLKINPEDVGFGKYNQFTGELEHSIPKYYTYDFTFKDGVNDYSDVSEDTFANLILYAQHVNKYKYLTEVEGQLKIVKDIENLKDHLKTDKAGNIVMNKSGVPDVEVGNKKNAELFDNFMRVLLYDQKYVLSDDDAAFNVGKATKGVRKLLNKIVKPVTGKDIFNINDESYTSMIKTIDAANRGFQLKTLGLDYISGAVNWFGGNIQSFVQSGNYFTGRELAYNQGKLISQKLIGAEKDMYRELVDTFMPMKDDPAYKLYKKAGMSVLTRRDLSDDLMVFMRKPEQLIEKTIFLSLLDNMMIEDGRIVSIPEFVKAKYKDRAESAAKYKESQKKIKEEIAELKKTRSISATKKLVDGKLVIPGLDLNNRDEIQRLTNLTRRISRNAVGGMTEGDINMMSMSIWTKSMMVFKGWIPKLTDTRFGEFRKVGDDFSVRINEDGLSEGEKYDIGRLRVLGYYMHLNIAKSIKKIIDALYMTEKGMEGYNKMYEEYKAKYEKKTGETLNMSKADFIDLMKNNLRKQIQELAILVSLLGASFAFGSVAPGRDDDKAAKNFHNYAQRVIDKFGSELSFFYNPMNYEELLGSGIFPAVGILTDFQKFGAHLWMQTTGLDLTDPTKTYEEVKKDAHPVKYLMKAAPVTKSLVTYFALFDSDWAEEQDITIQKNSGKRH